MPPVKSRSPVSYSGHETFPFRYGWLKKGLDALHKDPNVFSAHDATTVLGVGKNMVRSIKHWLLASGLVEDAGGSTVATWLGEGLFGKSGYDPYLEDISTLWLVHYMLCRAPGRSQSWYWVFNHHTNQEFSKDMLVENLLSSTGPTASRANQNTLRRDIDCLLGCYVRRRQRKGEATCEDTFDCPLTELGLIDEIDGLYRLQVGEHRTLSPELFAHSLLEFWHRVFPMQSTLAFEQIAFASGSPSKIFKLSYAGLMKLLESLSTASEGLLEYSDASGLRQIYRRDFDFSLERSLSWVYKRTACRQ